ncbi:MAG: class I SAM-dependent methyltransferase [Gemmatimonadales bacterium]|nr:class I SAM-dependent methyltransferase [Gemmatimonadales bacterium]
MAYSEAEYWAERYRRGGTSGAGSAGGEAAWKTGVVADLAKKIGAKSITDVGCGDGVVAAEFLRDLPGVDYVGVDIAAECLPPSTAGRRYVVGDAADAGFRLLPADLVLCFDVLFHASSQERHDRLVQKLCTAARIGALVITWNEGALRLGRLAAHNRFWTLSWPSGVRVAGSDVPGCPAKTLYEVRLEVQP